MSYSNNILSLVDASVGYHYRNEEKLLLDKVNIKVKTGELVGLIGRNGTGKSTLLRSIVRLQEFLRGAAFIQDHKIRNIHPNEFAKILAFVSSGLEYTETMTVREMVSLGRFPYTNWIGKLLVSDIEIIDEAIERVGIEHLAFKKLAAISDGERQKAMIARTLAQNTSIIVLDEPTAFLDLPSRYDIIGLLFELTRKGKTVIYSTHDLNIAIRFSDKIWLIDEKTIHDGSPEDLILDRTIAGIFDSDKIHLNLMTGDFEFRKKTMKKICLACENPHLAYWTGQALQRSGFELVNGNSDLPIVTADLADGRMTWEIRYKNESMSANCIYDLLSVLNNRSPNVI